MTSMLNAMQFTHTLLNFYINNDTGNALSVINPNGAGLLNVEGGGLNQPAPSRSPKITVKNHFLYIPKVYNE